MLCPYSDTSESDSDNGIFVELTLRINPSRLLQKVLQTESVWVMVPNHL